MGGEDTEHEVRAISPRLNNEHREQWLKECTCLVCLVLVDKARVVQLVADMISATLNCREIAAGEDGLDGLESGFPELAAPVANSGRRLGRRELSTTIQDKTRLLT